MTRPRLLVTGFSAFPGVAVNPTELLVRALDVTALSRRLAIEVATTVLPTEYKAVAKLLPGLWDKLHPHAVLHVGLQGRAATVRVETRAANRCSMRLPDAAGWRPKRPQIDPGGAPVRIATFPAARIAGAISARGIPARLSHDAGGYLCNFASYLSLGLAPHGAISGFVHLPWPAEERAPKAPHKRPSWAEVAAAIEIAIVETATATRALAFRS